ncbi:MAG: nucleotidyltransferase family protein [Bacteroidales bacterium]|nr:nucleotidyltransferase family protein [Bacteroidales bacterium]
MKKELLISNAATIKDALRTMDEVGHKLLIVIDSNNKFESLISIGDIQRAIIKGIDISEPIASILRSDITVATTNDNIDEVKQRMKLRRNEFMPIINEHKEIIRIILWDELFEQSLPKSKSKHNLPVIIMAGGEGRRLRPLTNVLPKPLIPIGEKTVIEHIMDRFMELGSNRFYISLNYKANFIEYYLNELKNNKWDVEYFREPKPLGTAGSLHLLKGKINETFFISNCDILIDQDYSEIVEFHQQNRNDITIVAAIKSIQIPYGVLNTGNDGVLLNIDEKPELTHKINTGLYILEPHLINEIPENTFFHITHLIEKVIERKGRVGVFPISEKSWTDIGTWQQYLNLSRGD